MRYDDFRALIARMTEEVPAHYLGGVAAVEVSRATMPDPARGNVYTMGECIPIETGSDAVQSRIVLYYGSFAALASERPGFAWREEAWETLTHELRHHLEWRARTDALEAYDWAAEQNFARQEGDPFDPVFHLSGELVAPGLYKVDDDFFIDQVVRAVPATAEVTWHAQSYRVTLAQPALPHFVVLEGLADAPPGEVVLVLRRRARIFDLFRRPRPPTTSRAQAEPVPEAGRR